MTAEALDRIRGYHIPGTTQPRHSCARCGRTLRDGDWIYSSHTGNRFCVDLKACDKRARRRG
jgi:hypothetical protein